MAEAVLYVQAQLQDKLRTNLGTNITTALLCTPCSSCTRSATSQRHGSVSSISAQLWLRMFMLGREVASYSVSGLGIMRPTDVSAVQKPEVLHSTRK